MSIQKESRKTKQAMIARLEKHKRWPDFAKKVSEHFLQVTNDAIKENFPENLYFSRDDVKRTIQLMAGNHAIDVTHSHKQNGNNDRVEVHSEDGAAIVVSQATTGNIAIFLYPYKSDLLKRNQDRIIWKIFDNPESINTKILEAATKDFFTYMRVSSAILTESSFDRLRIRFLEFRSKKFTEKGGIIKLIFAHWSWMALAAASSVAGIYSLWK